MKRASTPSFVLELEISFKDTLLNDLLKPKKKFLHTGSVETLNKKFNVANQVYNAILSEAEHRRQKVMHDREYQTLIAEYAALKKADQSTSDCSKKLNLIKKRFGYTEYDMHAYAVMPKYHFSNVLGIDECQKLASRAFKASESVLFGKADKVHYHRRLDDTSIEGKSENSSVKYHGHRCIQCGRGNIYPLIVKAGDIYAEDALKHRVKYVRILRRTIRGKQRYYAQLVMEGIPPKTKSLCYGNPDEKIGIDEGVSTAAVVSGETVNLYELAPGTAVDEKELRRLNRAIDRSLRKNNPDNYNPNGAVKKGKLKWNISKRCRLLKSKRKELYRRNAWNRKCSHNQLANKIIAVGTDIRVEDMSISGLAKRSKKTTISKKNGRPVSKKRYGKTILSRAPAMFINAIERKLSYIGIHINKLDAYEIKASQYNHITNSYRKKPLSQRWAEIGNDKIQRDLYSAFLIRNTTPTLDHIDQESCIKQYDHFKVLHDIEIKKLKKLDNPSLRWYIV